MRRVWWPEPLYEVKPFGALTLGVLAAAVAAARSLAVGSWEAPFAWTAAAGAGVIIYGIAVLVMRYRHRRRSRWNRERRG